MNNPAPERACSPEERRAKRRSAVREALSEALHESGASQAMCARLTGAPTSHVQSWADPEGSRNLALADAMGMPRSVQESLIRWWAESLGFDLAPRIDSSDVASVTERLACEVEAQAVARATLIRALADGSIDAREAVEIRAKNVAVIEHARAQIELCNRAEREGGIRISLVPQEAR